MSDKQIFECAVTIAMIVFPLIAFSAEATIPHAAETFEDIHGNDHALFDPPKNGVSVVVFITTDCPIANSYQPTLARLAKSNAGQNVSFFLVHPTNRVSIEKARTHAKDFQIELPIILDPEQIIANRVGARVTPEAFVIDSDGNTVYRGRIDDLYAGFGKKRRHPTRHDLQDAITAALAGKTPTHPRTDAIGCIITYTKKNDTRGSSSH